MVDTPQGQREGNTQPVTLRMPPEAVAVLGEVRARAVALDMPLFIVGGSVRDMLLESISGDLDLSLEGDALALAEELRRDGVARIVATHRFGTAELSAPGLEHFDLVTARREWYERPGALPSVEPGTIYDDLARRDFTVNAMALVPSGGTYARLLDPHGGRADIEGRLIRVLHERSFIDDPTRIWRAVKYSYRLGFKIEPHTLELEFLAIRDGAPATVSLDRHMRELLLVLREPEAGAILPVLRDIGLLASVHPQLEWRYEAVSPVRPMSGLTPEQRADVYLAIMASEYRADPSEAELFARSLGLDAGSIRLIRDAATLASLWPRLGEEGLTRSQVYGLLAPLSLRALSAYSRIEPLASDQPAHGRLISYIEELKDLKPELRGNYLASLGIAPGPIYREALKALRDAKLDGLLTTRQSEESFIEEWLKSHEGDDSTGGGPVR